MRRTRRSRKEQFIPNIDTEDWLAKNPDAMIQCPNQPGSLKLTRESCARRYMAANDPRWSNIGAEPFHIFVFKMNLITCRKCDVGAGFAKGLKLRAA